jgi:hypothetical protein
LFFPRPCYAEEAFKKKIFCFLTFAPRGLSTRAPEGRDAGKGIKTKNNKKAEGEVAFFVFLLPLVLIFILSFPLLVAEQRQERIKIIIKTRHEQR